MIEGPTQGLRLIEGLGDCLGEYTPYHSARADLLRSAGKDEEARRAYAKAVELADNIIEKTYFERRLNELSGGARSAD
ncbi:MAG TPA: hypothetical protein VJK02_11175 [Anaerolineales bacterium]|jgi:RNA polymerase sigma-70 factor (ECF subfamily)|nr:hypothetical protein [Anaerolineales bacterium]